MKARTNYSRTFCKIPAQDKDGDVGKQVKGREPLGSEEF